MSLKVLTQMTGCPQKRELRKKRKKSLTKTDLNSTPPADYFGLSTQVTVLPDVLMLPDFLPTIFPGFPV